MTFTVSELTNEIKNTLESGFSGISVIGEISNFKPHNSGHWYFNLKDSNATICCTMWKGFNNYVFFTPQDGIKVIVSGRISVYPPRGNYQIDVRSMRPAGAGELQAAFEVLKHRLAAEGLFSEAYKKPLPSLPAKIGIITAVDGAALKDMISICRRRFPLTKLLLAPAKVQGSGAADSIVSCIRELNSRDDIELIIIARGGGSIEDLWAFNEEKVARAIFDSLIPVMTGIGHEIDFTIADFAADFRAPTPSAAMELAVPDQREYIDYLKQYEINIGSCVDDIIIAHKERITEIFKSYGFRSPEKRLKSDIASVNESTYRIIQNTRHLLMLKKHRLSLLAGSLEKNDINRTLKKGFVLVRQGGKFVTRSFNFDETKSLALKFYDNEIVINKDAALSEKK
jgi:exodeoxyribonuclease VII large subunit